MAWFSWVALLVVVAGAALAAYCAMQFTTMPILFFGHIAAMLLCWWLMTSGSDSRHHEPTAFHAVGVERYATRAA
eukprot:g415.t1